MSSILTNPGNFANRPTEEVKEIARKGGLASHGIVEEEPSTNNTNNNYNNNNNNNNPGNFANRPTEEVQGIARKGGLASSSHGTGIVEKEDNTPVKSSEEESKPSGLGDADAYDVVADIPEVRKTRSQVTTRLDEQMAEGL